MLRSTGAKSAKAITFARSVRFAIVILPGLPCPTRGGALRLYTGYDADTTADWMTAPRTRDARFGARTRSLRGRAGRTVVERPRRGHEMMRRTGVLFVTALLVSSTAMVGTTTAPGGAVPAPTTPRVGTVACAVDGSSTFKPWLGYSPGRGQRPINPEVDSK